jgi:hypothetical protein
VGDKNKMSSALHAHQNGVETLLPLTTLEKRRLEECERTIKKGLNTFYDVGKALSEIKDSRLYRMEYATFEDYCDEKWGMSRRRGYEMIAAATVVDNVRNSAHELLPENEAQANEIASIDALGQQAIWSVVVGTADRDKDNKPIITAGHVRSVVNVITEVVRDGGLDDGSGEVKPLGQLIDAAVTEETCERMKRNKQYIRDAMEKDQEVEQAPVPPPKPKRTGKSEIELLQTPEVQQWLSRVHKALIPFEGDMPKDVPFLKVMIRSMIGVIEEQSERTVEADCDKIMSIFEGDKETAPYGLTDTEIYRWIIAHFYFIKPPEVDERLELLAKHSLHELRDKDKPREERDPCLCEPQNKKLKYVKTGGRKEGQKGEMVWMYMPSASKVFN